MVTNMIEHLQGDCRHVLRTLEDDLVDVCITSPTYWQTGGEGEQLGREKSAKEYIKGLGDVFDEVKMILKDKGILWLVLGGHIGVPFGVAFELQRRGWILQKDIIWKGGNNHDYIFLFTKREGFYFHAPSVWNVPAVKSDIDFDVLPEDLILPMVKTCPENGLILDCFAGSGAVGVVAKQEKKNAILIEINEKYIDLQKEKIRCS
tara:strand:- start:697 stop:1311 length:615 start_codon:yes stop_codon:yes gene_type:complete